jgi:single-stranded DNA-binding protein
MIVISIFGRVVSDPRSLKTQTNVLRVFFDVESTDRESLPIRHGVVSFGNLADRALDEIRSGDEIFISGRLSAGGAPPRVNVTLCSFEVLKGAPANAD